MFSFSFNSPTFFQKAQQRRDDKLQPEPAAAVQHGGVADAAAAERHGEPDPLEAEATAALAAAAEVAAKATGGEDAQLTARSSLAGSFFSLIFHSFPFRFILFADCRVCLRPRLL